MSANHELFLNQNHNAGFVLCQSHLGYTIYIHTIFFRKSIELRRSWDQMNTTCVSLIVFSMGSALYPIAPISKECKGSFLSKFVNIFFLFKILSERINDVLNVGIFRKSASSTFYSWMMGFFMVLMFPFQFCGRVIVLKKKDFPKYADVDNTMKTVFYAYELVRVKLCRIFDLCGNFVLKLQVFFAFFCINYSHFCLDLCAIVCTAAFFYSFELIAVTA